MSYNPSEDLRMYLDDIPLMSYRLVDGSYIIAEQVEVNEDLNVMYVGSPLQLTLDKKTQKSFLHSWLDSSGDELVTISGDKIIGCTETPFDLKLHYHRYLLLEKLKNNLTSNELEGVLNEMFNPPVDNQDFTEDEGEDWKEDFDFEQPLSDYHTEWRKKFRDNN